MPKPPPSTPIEHRVYDSYPRLFRELVTASTGIAILPLEAMLAVCDRIQHTRALIGPDKTLPADPQVMAAHRTLIAAAIVYRDACITAGEQ